MNKIVELKMEETKAVVGGIEFDSDRHRSCGPRWSRCFPHPNCRSARPSPPDPLRCVNRIAVETLFRTHYPRYNLEPSPNHQALLIGVEASEGNDTMNKIVELKIEETKAVVGGIKFDSDRHRHAVPGGHAASPAQTVAHRRPSVT